MDKHFKCQDSMSLCAIQYQLPFGTRYNGDIIVAKRCFTDSVDGKRIKGPSIYSHITIVNTESECIAVQSYVTIKYLEIAGIDNRV